MSMGELDRLGWLEQCFDSEDMLSEQTPTDERTEEPSMVNRELETALDCLQTLADDMTELLGLPEYQSKPAQQGITAALMLANAALEEHAERVEQRAWLRGQIHFQFHVARPQLMEICQRVRVGSLDDGDLFAVGGESLVEIVTTALEVMD